jgi:protein-S-isoprenylcysteine O-methyltransferase Ste14
MKASSFEFRFRLWIAVAIYVLGFVAPWDIVWHLDGSGPNAHVWARLAELLSRRVLMGQGLMNIGAAFNAVLIVGIACAAAGAWMRTWGSAYLGVDVMSDTAMRSDGVVADGPYRYLRNPLYVGVWLHTLALALLMPVSGAVFAVVGIIAFQVRLIFAEESFLRAKLGAPYVEYCAKVPRVLPALRPRVQASGAHGRWMLAALAEIFMWGMTATFAVLGWRYDADILLRAVLVWFGVSLIVRAVRGSRD